jgi:DNA-binding MurR/RpiR family transcriptional regulator
MQTIVQLAHRGAFTVASPTTLTSSLAELADRSIVTSIYEQFVQPDDLSAKHGQLLVLDLLYLLVAQENFDRSSAKLTASARAVSSHRRPRRTPPRATVAMAGATTVGSSSAAAREEADE